MKDDLHILEKRDSNQQDFGGTEGSSLPLFSSRMSRWFTRTLHDTHEHVGAPKTYFG